MDNLEARSFFSACIRLHLENAFEDVNFVNAELIIPIFLLLVQTCLIRVLPVSILFFPSHEIAIRSLTSDLCKDFPLI